MPQYQFLLLPVGIVLLLVGTLKHVQEKQREADRYWGLLGRARGLTPMTEDAVREALTVALRGTAAELSDDAHVVGALTGRFGSHSFSLVQGEVIVGRSTRPWIALVAERPGWRLPEMAVYPERGLDRLKQAVLGHEDLDFPEDPAFSQAYVVKARPALVAERLLDEEVRTRIRHLGQVGLKGGDDSLAIVRASPIRNDEIEGFLDGALAVAKAIAS